jgi:putative MATE family efflux protein
MIEKYIDKEIYKKIFKLGAPIALQALMNFSIALTDTFMMGRLGDRAISAAYMGNQIQLLLNFFILGVDGTILALASRSFGKKDDKGVRGIFSVGLFFALAVAVALTLVCLIFPSSVVSLFTNNKDIVSDGGGYLLLLAPSFPFFALTNTIIALKKSVESTKIGFITSLFAFSLNFILNYLFIFGNFGFPKLEIRGAALAALITRISEALLAVLISAFNKKFKIRLRDLKADKESIRLFFSYGYPIILGQIAWSANQLFATAIIGRQGSASFGAAMSVAAALGNLAYVATNGASGALGIITGKAIGENKQDYIKRIITSSQFLFICLGIATALAMQLLKIPFISVYKLSNEAKEVAIGFINILSLISIGTCYQSSMLTGLFKSLGDVKFVLRTEIFSIFFLVMPLALASLRLGASVYTIYLLLKIDQIAKCLPAALRLRRIKKIKRSYRN